MTADEEKDLEEMKKELAFYKNQTKVLRTRNRDLRNALLVAEKEEPGEQTATTATAPTVGETKTESSSESISDIRKIIATSKKQISEKLSQFKESIDDPGNTNGVSATTTQETPPTSTTSSPSKNGAPTTPKFTTTMETKPGEAQPAPSSAEVETLQYQVDYLKKEVDRLENFLEQSEMVNNRLRQLLSEHNIDVSEISKAIEEVSKTAISGGTKKKPEEKEEQVIPEPVKKEPVKKVEKEEPKPEEPKKKLDPEVENLFKEFTAKINSGINDEQIKMEILELREELMSYIPHSRVFYEMQIEYRKWKKGTSSVKDLKKAMKEWEQTIVSTM